MFVFSKLFWLVLQPSKLFWLLGLLSTIGLLLPVGKRLQRFCKLVLACLFSLLTVIVFFPVDDWLTYPLENRFPQPVTLPSTVDGIIILGGAFDSILTDRHNQISANGHIERVTEAISLHKQFPTATVLYTGGTGFLKQSDRGGADIAQTFFEQLGISSEKFVFESESRNTFENALYSKELINPSANQNWVLVTSAFHMPRSVGIFNNIGWKVIPYPVDYNSVYPEKHPGIEFGGKLSTIDKVTKEYVGLISYRLLGRTDSFFPKP